MSQAKFTLPTFPGAASLSQAVLFGFDDRAFPFQQGVQAHLIPGQNPRLVLEPGPPGSHDEVVLYYGTILHIDGRLHLWYYGSYGPPRTAIGLGHGRTQSCLCYARSEDGVTWEKPNLGLVEFNGARNNNIVDFPEPHQRPAAVILYEPDDPDPSRRFKLAYEATVAGQARFCVAFSADGLHWTLSSHNPTGPFLEMAGLVKFQGVYYVNGQASELAHRPTRARRLVTFASTDFEHWSPCGAVGLDRAPDLLGPSNEHDWNMREEIHLGAAIWDRSNVLLGVYGQWHGHPSGDRRLLTMDLGLALSHDGLHYYEPLPDFRLVRAREQPMSQFGDPPALMQGQGFAHIGDETLYWYSLWRGIDGSGVRMVTWERDRLGMLKPFRPSAAQAISAPIQAAGAVRTWVNVSGLGPHSQLRVGLLDEGFRPIAGYQDAVVTENGFRIPLRWPTGDTLPDGLRVRLDIHFEGIRPEDSRLHAVYLDS